MDNPTESNSCKNQPWKILSFHMQLNFKSNEVKQVSSMNFTYVEILNLTNMKQR